MIIEYVAETEAVEVEELDDTIRGEGGFGSTGVKIWETSLIFINFLKIKFNFKINFYF